MFYHSILIHYWTDSYIKTKGIHYCYEATTLYNNNWVFLCIIRISFILETHSHFVWIAEVKPPDQTVFIMRKDDWHVERTSAGNVSQFWLKRSEVKKNRKHHCRASPTIQNQLAIQQHTRIIYAGCSEPWERQTSLFFWRVMARGRWEKFSFWWSLGVLDTWHGRHSQLNRQGGPSLSQHLQATLPQVYDSTLRWHSLLRGTFAHKLLYRTLNFPRNWHVTGEETGQSHLNIGSNCLQLCAPTVYDWWGQRRDGGQ